eukprot:2042413-Pyramimonas_sp.AAC.1
MANKRPETSWMLLGVSLDVSRGLPWRPLRGLLVVSGVSWGVLGAVGGLLGASLGPFGLLL